MNARSGLRVVVTGATGNVGISVMKALAADESIASILGLARRLPALSLPKAAWGVVDLSQLGSAGELRSYFVGADVVVHLAWRFQPTHDPVVTWHNNVAGSMRVFEAVREAGVPALVYASSVAAYSPGPKTEPGVREEWPTHGWPDAAYCLEKAYVERVLDIYELENPDIRVVRMRPGFLFQEPHGQRTAPHLRRAIRSGSAAPSRPVAVGAGSPRAALPGAPYRRCRSGLPCGGSR